MTTTTLLQQHAAAWHAATHHPFLDAARAGTLAREAFDRWLVQDYLFVADLLCFQARLLARAPRYAQAVLAGGLVALEAELGWFEQHAARRRLDLQVPRLPASAAYLAVLERLDLAPVAVALTSLWAIERAYLEAWRSALPGHAEYADFVTHWTTSEFDSYVRALGTAADTAHDDAPGCAAQAEAAFLEIAALERDFWNMAFA